MHKLMTALACAAALLAGAGQAQATVVYASSVISADSTGKMRNGADISSTQLVAASALGGPSDVTPDSTGFYSLGFGGSITLAFDSLIGPGTATFYESTSGTIYPREAANIYLFDLASSMFVFAGTVDNQPIGTFDTLDFSGLCSIGCSQMQIVDVSLFSDFAGYPIADGYDVNAIAVTAFAAPPAEIPEPATLPLMALASVGAGLVLLRRSTTRTKP